MNLEKVDLLDPSRPIQTVNAPPGSYTKAAGIYREVQSRVSPWGGWVSRALAGGLNFTGGWR